jgi:tRNA(Ile)-lysidine synthase
MSEVAETVRRFIEREHLFESREKILAAVSGGADSLCLLILLRELGYPLQVAHFDHQLRPDSGRDAEVVRSAAGRLSVPFTLGQGDVRGHARRNRLTLEEAARVLRYDFLFRTAKAAGAGSVATGHTMNDQAETVLLHLVRGTGVKGLGGMRPVAVFPRSGQDPALAKIRLVRPLLCLTHAEAVAFCRKAGGIPVEDPGNQDPAYTRNNIRRELLPFLEKYNTSIVEGLSSLAGIARGQNDFVEGAAEKIWLETAHEVEPGLVRLPVEAMRSAPPAVQQALARRAVFEAARTLEDLAGRHVTKVVEFVRRPTASRRMDLALGVAVSMENDWLVFCAPGRRPAVPDWEGRELPIPGSLTIRHPDWQILTTVFPESSAAEEDPARDPWTVRIDPVRIRPPIILRRRKSGEKFFPSGMPGLVKLNDFLASHHMALSERDCWPLICDTDGIIWIPGFRAREGTTVAGKTQGYMKIEVKKVSK